MAGEEDAHGRAVRLMSAEVRQSKQVRRQIGVDAPPAVRDHHCDGAAHIAPSEVRQQVGELRLPVAALGLAGQRERSASGKCISAR